VTILDTNVLSELMQASPDGAVVDWVDRQPSDELWITSITVYELRLGLALLAAGRRRRALEEGLILLLANDLEHRVVDFDTAAATTAAALTVTRRKRGRPVDFRDTQIAGIVLARRAILATRNVKHFLDLDVPVVNPWEE
jgi:predicted nucleic acid-binding protein